MLSDEKSGDSDNSGSFEFRHNLMGGEVPSNLMEPNYIPIPMEVRRLPWKPNQMTFVPFNESTAMVRDRGRVATLLTMASISDAVFDFRQSRL